ncbi:hypothetical protein ACFL43_01500 [Thermodesulfobacteriota bacterium]
MNEYVGIWIGHDKAVIVTILGEEHTVTTLKSHSSETRQVSFDGIDQTHERCRGLDFKNVQPEERQIYMERYYRRILDSIEEPQGILIFGPDETKMELEKVLGRDKKFGAVNKGIRTAGPMGVDQIAEYAGAYFRHHDHGAHGTKGQRRSHRKSA